MTTFRNVEFDVDAPVATWPYEALVTLIERGTVTDWARLVAEVRREPWGVVAQQLEQYLSYERPWGVAPLLERAITRSRVTAAADERAEVARRVRELVERSGLTPAEFAGRIGTSRTRLSTYRSGSVTPSAALLVRMTHLVDRLTR